MGNLCSAIREKNELTITKDLKMEEPIEPEKQYIIIDNNQNFINIIEDYVYI